MSVYSGVRVREGCVLDFAPLHVHLHGVFADEEGLAEADSSARPSSFHIVRLAACELC